MGVRGCLCVSLCLALPAAGADTPAGTAFTYQGRLNDGGAPANETYDLQLVLYTAATGGSQVGPVLGQEDVVVAGGLFTLSLDYGPGAFAGSSRFLEVGVRPGGSTGPFTILSPRQELTPAPHAIFASSIPLAGSGSAATAARSDHDHASTYALSAHTHGAADLTSGTVAPARLSGAYGGLTGVGTVTSGTWTATPIGPLFGGTAQSTYVAGDLLFASAANTLGRRAIGSGGQVLSVAGGFPVWLDAGLHDHLGQTWSTASAVHGLQVTSSSALAGSALRGVHTGAGGISAGVEGFSAQDVTGAAGVHGVAATPSAAVSGIFGEAVSTSGRGVFGAATAASGLTYGVYGTVNSPTGWGLYTPNRAFVGASLGIGAATPASALHVMGQGRFEMAAGSPPLLIPTPYAPGQTVTNLSADRLDGLDAGDFAPSAHDHVGQSWTAASGSAGLGVANGSSAAGSAGLLGEATNPSAVTYGVFGRSASSGGRGVFGRATATTGAAVGVRGESAADNGTGVHGFASSGVGTTTGVRGEADSVLGRGVVGEAFSSTGTTYGVYGNAISPDGWGLFTPGRAYAASLAVGTLTPGALSGALTVNAVGLGLDVRASGSGVANFNRLATDGVVVTIAQDGVAEGNISVVGTTVSYNAFTGSHYAWIKEPIQSGLLVSLTGDNKRSHDRPGAEPIYGVAPTARANDPAVLGSYLGRLEPGRPDLPVTENPHLVAAVGNGELCVVDRGADVAPGDALVSSDVAGHAMRDDDRFAVSHVVARAAEPVAWDDVAEAVDGVKHRRISVLFESHVRDKTAGILALAERIDALEAGMRACRPGREAALAAAAGQR